MEKSEEYGAVCSATALKMLSWCQLFIWQTRFYFVTECSGLFVAPSFFFLKQIYRKGLDYSNV